jgi:oligoribonuclease
MSKNGELLWVDMEMTGLDVKKEVPIEVAAIATDWQLNVLDEYHAVICQPQHYLDNMDDWNRTHHRDSGLTALIPTGKDPLVVDQELAAFSRKYFPYERGAILAGNSIAQDRLFIDNYMPKFQATLHYRMMDVTSWKVIFNGIYDLRFKKKDGHRALDDIRESIGEMKYYLSFINPLAHVDASGD